MSKRAEEAALKAYPKEDNKAYHSSFGTITFDKNALQREAFKEGYEQAEKDLTFSPEDKRPEKWSEGAKEAVKNYFSNPKSLYSEIYVAGYMDAEYKLTLTCEDIEKIGDLFNECQNDLEKANQEYADYGLPSNVLAGEVLRRFNEYKEEKK